MGWETELFTFKTVHDEHEADLVLRVFSGERAGSKASKEFYLMKRLDEVGYTVPHVYHIDTSGDVIGKPFLIMQRIIGTTLDDVYRSEDDEKLREGIYRLMELFVGLHKLDVNEFAGLPDLPTVSITEYINRFHEAKDEYTPWVAPVIDWLRENKPEDRGDYQAICHNDYHGFNVMIDQNDKAYVIDWGSARICDSRIDLGWTLLLYSTFGGAMFKAPVIETYNELGGYVDSLSFFEVLACTRRIIDLVTVLYGDGSVGLKPDVLNLMKKQRDHFQKVHDHLEETTGIRLAELDKILEEF
jgi:aminoglycoside phosphotransferase (APT) family kinase protein